MKSPYLAILSLLFAADVPAHSLYLTCTPISSPTFNVATAYKTTPKNLPKNWEDKFLQDMAEAMLLGWVGDPPKSWVIDLTEKRIYSPENDHLSLNATSISEVKIVGQIRGANIFNLNRITGTLEYTKHLDEYSIKSWTDKHKGTLPAISRYTYKCSAATRPAI